MARPPLDVFALFEQEPPRQSDLAIAGSPPFRARPVNAPPQLLGHLAEPGQPLNAEERAVAALSRGVLHIRCEADLPPAERLPGCVEVIWRCWALGALAFVLPAAHKIIGPSALGAVAPQLDNVTGWLKLFLQFYVVRDDEHAWSHTHGMEHFGLPDVECRTVLAEVPMAERLLRASIHHLMDVGGDALELGDLVEATESDDQPIARAWVYPPRPVVAHEYGVYGALQLVPDPRWQRKPSPG
jgi:hypothetical protein